VKYGRLANPAWGHTVDPEEFLSDYKKSKRSILRPARLQDVPAEHLAAVGNPWLRGFVRGRFRELAKQFCIRELAYDPRFAEETTQALSDGVSDNEGKVIEEGTGVERFAFDQNDNNYAAPTDDFERLVIEGKMRHNGHPVLTWQAGHAHVIRRQSKVKRVVKPSQDSPRTVDGIQGSIMALARATATEAAGAGGVEFW
jgi:hypothetical protein